MRKVLYFKQSNQVPQANIFRLRFLIIGCLLSFLYATVEAQNIDFNNTIPTQISVCHSTASFDIEFTNNTGSILNNVVIDINFPTGIRYIAGSISELSTYNVQELTTTNLSAVSFTANDLPVGESINFSITAEAGFDALTHQQNGNVFRNTVSVYYNGGTESDETDAYNLLYPALTIVNVDPISAEAFVGGDFTRTVTIVNGGYGSLSNFTLSDIYDANLQLNEVDLGMLNAEANEITFSATDFFTIGNGDAYLDQNESITIIQKLTALGCDDTQSELVASWGCDGQSTTSNSKFPYTSINLYPPNLSITPVTDFNTCVDGSANVQQLVITNNGTGPANELEITIAQLEDDMYSAIDQSAITFQQGNTTTSFPLSATVPAYNHDCLVNNPVNGFTISLPTIAPGETAYLNWDSYTCATDVCSNVHFLGWEYDLNYTDMCSSQIYEKEDVGQELKEKNISIFYESPSDLSDGQTGEYNFILSSATFDLPEGDAPYFEAIFDIPQSLNWSGQSSDLVYISGQAEWEASSITFANDKLTARYALPIPFNLTRSEFKLKLSLDCSSPNATGGMASVGMQLFYIMNSTCTDTYRMPLTCREVPQTQLHCPGPCSEGLAFTSFDVVRTSYGQADNDRNGLADTNGSLDLDKVKLNRVMANDTFKTIFNGIVKTSASYPSWQYAYASSEIPYGNTVKVLSANVSIYDASTGETLTCDNVPITQELSGGMRTVSFDFSAPTLATSCSAFSNWEFENDDQITLEAHYTLDGNIGGKVEQVMIQNEFYLSPSANGSKHQCNDWNGNVTFIGYYFTSWKSEQHDVEACTETVSQNFYMSIGTCCSNYAGGDLFPYEYRNWGNVKGLRVEIPLDYHPVSMYMNQRRTLYTNATTVEYVSEITPTSIQGQTYYFDLEQYYIQNGGTLNLGDDGFHGTVSIELQPECVVNPVANLPMSWHYTFRKNDFIGGGITDEHTITPDYIKYKKANLELSTTLQTVEGVDPTVSWEVTLKNKAVTPGTNSWLSIEAINEELENIEVLDLSTNTVITPTNNFYQLGDIDGWSTKEFRITANYASCENSNLNVHAGYDCNGYPVHITVVECGYKTLPLQVIPQESALQIRLESSTNPLDVCDNRVGIELEMLSAKLGAVKDIIVNIIPPNSQSISVDPSSTQVLYPNNGTYQVITDPTFDGTMYSIDGADLSSQIGENGLPGLTDLSANKVKLKFDLILDNNFQAGEFVQFEIKSKRNCGDDLPTLKLAYDPNAVFGKAVGIGLDETGNNWAASWGDYNDDGFVDLFVTNYNTEEPNLLYKNDGNGGFEKVTTGKIVTDLASSLASTWGDYDNDGDLDLFVANNIGFANALYRNDGNGSFTSIVNDPIAQDIGYSHGASWVDYNNDGYLDLFVTDYFSTKFNQLFHNNGDGTFSKNTTATPTLEAAFSICGVWGDYNNDGYPDLFVANANNENNSLYKNKGNGVFEKITSGAIVNNASNSVGASWGDYNNDGYLDLFVANSSNQNNFLYRNNGNETFTKITTGNIVTDAGHSHGSAWADYNNDGHLDLFVTNDQGQNNQLYANNGDGTFTSIANDMTQDGGESLGCAWADFDNDGDVDLYVANHEENANSLYENVRGKCQSKSCVVLIGSDSNRSAIGAKIRMKASVYGKSMWQKREITAQSGGGIGGQNELKTIIGLGDATIIDSIIIDWPSGHQQVLTNQAVNDCLTITEENAAKVCGTVYNDKNGNCTQDEGEENIANLQIKISPSNRIITTDSLGQFSTQLGLGEYILSADENNYWSPSCDSTQTVNVTDITQTYCDFKFAYTAKCPYPDLKVDIATTAHRVGFENLIALTYSNEGTAPATRVNLTIMFGPYIIPLEPSVPWDLEAGTDRRWTFDELAVGESHTIYITDSVSTYATIGKDIKLRATIYGQEDDCNGYDNITTDYSPAVGAIDPNDILVSPEGYIENTEELTYKIRFQNVGNAMVSTVRLTDQLPENLDPKSLVLGVTSHPYRFSMDENNMMVWEFENINMPDSTSNEAMSHGFAVFKIKPKKGLEDGATIQNNALIYFDNQAPVKTNTVTNTIGKAIVNNSDNQLQLYPNPMGETVMVEMKNPENNDLMTIQSIEVYNLFGQLVISKSNIGNKGYLLEREQLSAGTYIVKAMSEENTILSEKLIVQ